MMYGTMNELQGRLSHNTSLQQALRVLQKMDTVTLQKGRNEVSGEEIFINRMEYATAGPEEKKWETHQAYYDIHCALEGEGRVQLSRRNAMTEKEDYHSDGDYEFFDGAAQQEILLKPGAILICEPEDVHKVGIAENAPATIQKMVMKVKISD